MDKRLIGLLIALLDYSLTTMSWAQFVPSAPRPLNANAATDTGHDESPQAATDHNGTWICVWQSYDSLGGTIGADADLLVAKSIDNGSSWSAPIALNSNAATDFGGDAVPHLATDDAGNWVVVWFSNDTLGGTIGSDFDILVSHSNDNGLVWSAPIALNTNAVSDSGGDLGPRVATDGAGNWVAVWNSDDTLGGTKGSDWDLLFARSTDSGITWTPPTVLNTNANVDSGFDLNPHLAASESGVWIVVWNSNDSLNGTIGGDVDILASRSIDSGLTWSAPFPVNPDAHADVAADLHPDIATNDSGHWVVVWDANETVTGMISADRDIAVSRSNDDGLTWLVPVSLNSNALTDAGEDWDPDLATDHNGNWVVAWRSTDTLAGTIGTDWDILGCLSTDNGATWTDPSVLNTQAPTDSGFDVYPDVVSDRGGNWIALWWSNDTLSGTIGSDNDILLTTFSWPLGPLVPMRGPLILGGVLLVAAIVALHKYLSPN